MDQKKLDQQSQYWEASFLNNPEMFGLEPSIAAIKALKFFKEQNIKNIVELGAGLGRDTVFFAKSFINVEALDYSKTSIESITYKATKLNLNNFINPKSALGSCIFLHLTKDYKPTAGCIALKKIDFLILLKLIEKNTKIKIF